MTRLVTSGGPLVMETLAMVAPCHAALLIVVKRLGNTKQAYIGYV